MIDRSPAQARWFTVVACCLLAATVWSSPLRADILAPGAKRVSHELVIENLREFPDDAFFSFDAAADDSAPVTADGKVSRVNGSPINLLYLVSIPKSKLAALGGRPDPAWFRESRDTDLDLPSPQLPDGVACTLERMPYIRAIDAADPAVRIVTYLRIGKVGNVLKVLHAEEKRLGPTDPTATTYSAGAGKGSTESADTSKDPGEGAPILIWAGIPAVAIGVILVILRRRRRAARRMDPD
jgi:LPXTG-motif cell wall-anchored protein